MSYQNPERIAREAAHEAFLKFAREGGWSTATEGLDLAIDAYIASLERLAARGGPKVVLTLPLLNGQ